MNKAFLIAFLFLSACTATIPKKELVLVNLYPYITEEQLECAVLPSLEGVDYDTQFDILTSVAQDCSKKLRQLNDLVRNWEAKMDEADSWYEEGDNY